jgi:hypothetical protein
MSKIFTDGGLYELSVFLEKSRNLDIAQWNTVVPFVFKTENINHAALHRKKLLDLGHISINPKFSNLIMALRGAVFNEFKLDKDESVNEGLMDTYLMLTGGVTFFKFKSPSDY